MDLFDPSLLHFGFILGVRVVEGNAMSGPVTYHPVMDILFLEPLIGRFHNILELDSPLIMDDPFALGLGLARRLDIREPSYFLPKRPEHPETTIFKTYKFGKALGPTSSSGLATSGVLFPRNLFLGWLGGYVTV